MPQINVTIDGKSYRMACAEGEEPHLAALAASFGAKVAEMRQAFGEIGDMRLQVMAALTQADELLEVRRRLADLEAETGAIRERLASLDAERAVDEAQLEDGLNRAAERIERLAHRLATG
ncbi:cell division protein ZapA [Methylobacterium sp. Leaf399]|uniref:cell division protein ZapA n=1 Tax=unclassified Methylobacterium TaxID=2615210 RepID=UPI0006F966AA|nr:MULTISPECIES: cell division protein ZapA [unclassified Methylobacterium]KQP56270.1 cell division protein ZapA [Methylobacterium sp. Leaf108]KQT19040.1 cell division protein ZapA [Methylobacterium sp. Leaf399]KQT85682.1 cell division protein ZapA [Methylobacterium sp. Leaf466]